MISSRRARAAAAFAAMTQLDASAPEIQELRASGVNQHRIDALYPESPFASIAPGLIERLPRIAPSRLAAAMDPLSELTMDVSTYIVGPIIAKIYRDWEAWRPPDDDARAAFARAIDERLGLPIGAPTAVASHTYGADRTASACWWAWFSMMNRASLPRGLRRRSDKLMLAVADTFDLG